MIKRGRVVLNQEALKEPKDTTAIELAFFGTLLVALLVSIVIGHINYEDTWYTSWNIWHIFCLISLGLYFLGLIVFAFFVWKEKPTFIGWMILAVIICIVLLCFFPLMS